jgi:hypothetical protein
MMRGTINGSKLLAHTAAQASQVLDKNSMRVPSAVALTSRYTSLFVCGVGPTAPSQACWRLGAGDSVAAEHTCMSEKTRHRE